MIRTVITIYIQGVLGFFVRRNKSRPVRYFSFFFFCFILLLIYTTVLRHNENMLKFFFFFFQNPSANFVFRFDQLKQNKMVVKCLIKFMSFIYYLFFKLFENLYVINDVFNNLL